MDSDNDSYNFPKCVPLVLDMCGLGPYSRPLAQFFPIRTSRPANNIYIQISEGVIHRAPAFGFGV